MECIGTPRCSTSPGPCGQWLTSSEGKEQCCWQLVETPGNIDDVDHALFEGGRLSLACKPLTSVLGGQFIPRTFRSVGFLADLV
ncbi:MAG: hypothetical protein ACFFD4_22285 [Candidatus Odinarchaeota archaeon]